MKKKLVRLLIIAALVSAVLVLALVGVALTSSFQTWAVRKAAASQPQLKARVGNVSAGFNTVELHDIHLEQDGAVIDLPSLTAELSTIKAGVSQQIDLRRLVAKGWTLDLTKYKFTPGKPGVVQAAPIPRGFSLVPSAYAAPAAVAATTAAVTQVFQGVFTQATLPVDLAVGDITLEGDILLPPAPGVTSAKAHLVFGGGGLAAQHEGVFSFTITVALTGPDVLVNSLAVTGRLTAAMDTPRTFTRLATKAEASAKGPQVPNGVKLLADIAAARGPQSETYAITVASEHAEIVSLQAEYPLATSRLAGAWKINARTADIAPFSLGRPLPQFDAVGSGKFDSDASFTALHLSGELKATADKLGVILPQLAAMGGVKLTAEFDVAHQQDALRVDRLTVALDGPGQVLAVQSLQAFEFNAKSGDLKVADPARELVGVSLRGVPLAWARPFLGDVTLTGDALHGELALSARNGGLTLRGREPLTITNLSVTRGSDALARAVDVSAAVSADYTPQGWQAELALLTLRSAGATLLTLETKAGQLVGANQPIKATGKLSTNLPALLAQPAMASLQGVFTQGALSAEFTANVAAKTEVGAKLAITDLVADPKLTAEKLPAITSDLHVALEADGRTTLTAPLIFERNGRKSDLSVEASVASAKAGLNVDAKVASTQLYVDDVQIFAAPFASPPSAAPATPVATTPAGRDTVPFWSGLNGSIALALKRVIYGDKFEVSDVGGTLKLDAGSLKLDGVRAGLGQGSDAKVNAAITFDGKTDTPYALTADVAVNNFDTVPLFNALNPNQPPTVEGKFTIASQLSGKARSVGELVERTNFDYSLTSKGGVFRGLPTSIAAKAESASRLASVVAIASNLGGLFGGGKSDKAGEIANKAQAVAEISSALSAIKYDQLNVVIARDASLNTLLKEFTLIAPEMRLQGTGQILYKPETPLLQQSLGMQFKLRARGHAGDLLKYVGVLDPKPDEIGYSAVNLPLNVTGTLEKPDTSELQNALTNLAVEKSGALDYLKGLIPGGK